MPQPGRRAGLVWTLSALQCRLHYSPDPSMRAVMRQGRCRGRGGGVALLTVASLLAHGHPHVATRTAGRPVPAHRDTWTVADVHDWRKKHHVVPEQAQHVPAAAPTGQAWLSPRVVD